MKKYLCLFILLLSLPGVCFGLDYTSTQTGNWSDAATWGGSGPPVDEDTATVASGHTVTLTANAEIGTSPNGNTTILTINGTLNLASYTLVTNGDISVANGGTLQMGAGSVLEFDSSGSGGTPNYRLIMGGSGLLDVDGVSGNRATLRKNAAGADWNIRYAGTNQGQFDVAYANFSGMDGALNGGSMDLFIAAGYNSLWDHVQFDDCDLIYFVGLNASANLSFTNNTFVNSTSFAYNVRFVSNAASATGTRTFSGNVFDQRVFLPNGTVGVTGWTIENNYFASPTAGYAPFDAATGAPTSFQNNLFYAAHDDVTASINMLGTIDRGYHVADIAGNPHYMGLGAAADGTVTIQNQIFEQIQTLSGDRGDCLLPGPITNTLTVNFKNNIVLPEPGGDTSGTLFTLLRDEQNTVTFNFTRNTYIIGNSPPTAHENNGESVTENVVFRSNLAWDTSVRAGKIRRLPARDFAGTADSGSTSTSIYDASAGWTSGYFTSGTNSFIMRITSGGLSGTVRAISANTADTLTVADLDGDPTEMTFEIYCVDQIVADYNNGYNFDNTKNWYSSTDYSATAGGYDAFVMSASPGANDLSVDPDFVDETRDLAAWDTSLSGAGTAASALAELRNRNDDSGYDSNYTISALIDYVQAGFVPQATALNGAGYGGEDIGAMDITTGARLLIGF